MVQGNTVADLFALAIMAEKSAVELYRRLAARFADYDDVAQFWRRYVADEVFHTHWLERLRGDLDDAQLAVRADPAILEKAHRAASVSVEAQLADVHNLAQAYELVNDLENSEITVVFEFMISSFPTDPDVLSFLRTHLMEHIDRLATAFPERFRDPGMRLAAVARTEEKN
jgi:rubrerythrin